ncbi:MAG: hypothetical protein BWX84_02748 [Verrucomicrobia bacterium ADurb.Bin118]|jgi:hypothetical protein|nr:MAG: hypothetical protein BWX84_02748 [Verrucomicrobia bacterium ADurb.Bin118]
MNHQPTNEMNEATQFGGFWYVSGLTLLMW